MSSYSSVFVDCVISICESLIDTRVIIDFCMTWKFWSRFLLAQAAILGHFDRTLRSSLTSETMNVNAQSRHVINAAKMFYRLSSAVRRSRRINKHSRTFVLTQFLRRAILKHRKSTSPTRRAPGTSMRRIIYVNIEQSINMMMKQKVEGEKTRIMEPRSWTRGWTKLFFVLDVEKLWRQLEFERWNGGKKYERNKNSLLLVRNAIRTFLSLLEFYFRHDLMYREANSPVNCANFRLKYQQ